MTEEVHVIVRGLVQGVYYRQFTVSEARRLGLTGWVRNDEDGESVELVARGPRRALDSLLERLRVGPPEARVDSVEGRWGEPGGDVFTGFGVRG